MILPQEFIEANLSNDLKSLNDIIKSNFLLLNNLIEKKRDNRDWPIYHSLDLRVSNYKICHVDSNLFPSGFSHLSENGIEESVNNFKKILYPYKKILILIENFTRNQGYLENILKLKHIIFRATNAEIEFATIGADDNKLIQFHEIHLTVHKLKKKFNKAFIEKEGTPWYPDFILLNNDLTAELPLELEGIEQKISPNPNHGWHNRKKSEHFKIYNQLVTELSEIIKFNPFFITTSFDIVKNVNFRNKMGFAELENTAIKIIDVLKEQYENNKISQEPYIFLKSDKGTFGMGVIDILEINKILKINKKDRHSMHAIKHGIINSEILIQEGIITNQIFNESPSEKIIYSVNGEIVGEIIRYNNKKNNHQNLNSNGMSFLSLNQFNIEEGPGYINWFINKTANLACSL